MLFIYDKTKPTAVKEKDREDLNQEENIFNDENSADSEADFLEEEAQAPEEEESDTEVAQLKSDLQEQKEKYLRLVAEFDNFRKRNSRERLELIQTANKDVITALLEVLDDVDRATEQMESTDNIDALKQGITLIFNKLKTRLQSLGLKEMDSLHADFDAELHDAITEIPAPSKELKGKVVDNVQKGYYLNDKLIRHAKVVVGK